MHLFLNGSRHVYLHRQKVDAFFIIVPPASWTFMFLALLQCKIDALACSATILRWWMKEDNSINTPNVHYKLKNLNPCGWYLGLFLSVWHLAYIMHAPTIGTSLQLDLLFNFRGISEFAYLPLLPWACGLIN
jgi:hypothetical protein